jgi:hypothetical protein
MSFDFQTMLQTIQSRQWSLADIDWEAPGAETMSDELRERLRPFMVDLVWIEHLGARGFASLAAKAPTPSLRDVYLYFQAEEQKHANAELALMKRWRMLDEDGSIPEPNINVGMAIKVLDTYGDDLPLTSLSALIALLECALDGALVKFLLDEVEDPLCHEVFRHINEDESRHLAVDFQVLEMLGARPKRARQIKKLFAWKPQIALGLVVFIPLINKMRDNVVAMGLSEQQLYRAVQRFVTVGSRGRYTTRLPSYRFIRRHAEMIVNRSHPYHRVVADPLVKLSARVPRSILGEPPTWTEELTHEAVAS